jgi:hypothetical protein
MKNTIIRELMKRLANAPKIVAKQYLNTLTNVEDKNDCKRLLKALGIETEEEQKQYFFRGVNVSKQAYYDLIKWSKQEDKEQ